MLIYITLKLIIVNISIGGEEDVVVASDQTTISKQSYYKSAPISKRKKAGLT